MSITILDCGCKFYPVTDGRGGIMLKMCKHHVEEITSGRNVILRQKPSRRLYEEIKEDCRI